MLKRIAAIAWVAVCALALVTASSAGAVALPNPVREVTAQEFQEEMGVSFTLPEGAQETAYSIIDMREEEDIGQVQFVLDGVHYGCRVQPGVEQKDISGMYYEWTAEESVDLSGVQAEALYNEGEAGILLWYNADRQLAYSVSMGTGATMDALVAVAEAITAGEEADDGDESLRVTYELEEETTLTVRLRENPTTGYEWTYEISDEALLKCEKEEYVPDGSEKDLVGAGGTYVAVFSPALEGAGAVKLTFRLARDWEAEQPLQTHTFNLWIYEAGTLSVEGVQ